jgi:tetratricopeptide (TPR) repeat protein
MNKRITLCLVAFFLTGCVRVVIPPTTSRPTPAPREPAPVVSEPATPTPRLPVEKPEKKITPRATAALELTEQGKVLIKRRRPDAAIRALERAMNLYPKDGKIYYYLAEAWLQKGNIGQAAEFNQLARVYLQKDPNWASQIDNQRVRIQSR